MKWLSKLKVEDLFPTEYGLMDSFGLNRIFKLIIVIAVVFGLIFSFFMIFKVLFFLMGLILCDLLVLVGFKVGIFCLNV